MDPAARRRAWQRQERDDLEEARARRARPARLEATIELLAITIAELARRAADREELANVLASDPPCDLTARWRAR